MPIIDGDRDEIVIRIVYDGPPLAGKTTSLRTLTGILPAGRRSDLFTPGEAEGRTLYFDWVDYLGGWFDGLQVRCQIVSVPGQRSLEERRRVLLREADAVVFVAESTPDGVELAIEYYAELRETLPASGESPVPVVLQANKQDLSGALGADELRDRLPDEHYLAILGSAAASGEGVKEAFTFAVRLALDRVRTLAKEGKLRVGEPQVRSGEDLLDSIVGQEKGQPLPIQLSHARAPAADACSSGAPGSRPSGDATSTRGPTSGEAPPARPQPRVGQLPTAAPVGPQPRIGRPPELGPPAAPTSAAPSGLVWPPMAGRIVLRELEAHSLEVEPRADGAWTAVAGGRWRLVSEAGLVFDGMESGRNRLLEAARIHTALEPLLSERRALVLAETGDGRWRLWKIVRVEGSLQDAASVALAGTDAAAAASSLFDIADALVDADRRFREARAPLIATLNQLSASKGRSRYLGIVPDSARPVKPAVAPETLVRRQLGPYFERAMETRAFDIPMALNRLREILREQPERVGVLEALAAMLIGH